MKGYQEISSQDDMDRLLAHASGFHDSMVKEFRVINLGYVLPDRSMAMAHQFDGQLLVQLQTLPLAMELLFSKISELRISSAGPYWSASGKVLRVGRNDDRRIELDFEDQIKVVAERVFHADRSSLLGPRAFLGPEMPSVDAVLSRKIEGRWRQCSTCSDRVGGG